MAYYNEHLLAFSKESDFDTDLTNGNIKPTSVAFIEESGRESIHTQGKSYQMVPSDGGVGQVLLSRDGKGVWVDLDILDILSYGVEWKPNVADPVLTRVGNMNYHRTLPIQSGMKGCIYNSKEKRVVYWLDEDNWNYKKGGNPNKGEVEDLARLDGYDGEVMVYVPEFYIKSWDESDRRCVRISPTKIDETWEHQPALYLSAYRDTLLNTVPEDMGYLSTLEVNTAISVANDQPYCRGGNNDASYDTYEDIFRGQLGKCRTSSSRANFRTWVRKTGKEILSYRQYKNIIYWLWVIEYATFNFQATYEPELTAEGFRQGGLGSGPTTMTNWNNYNRYFPIVPNGYTNELGNRTGTKSLIIPEFIYGEGAIEVAQTLRSTRWRGLEDIFGHVWHNVDGIIVDADADNHSNNMNYVYTTDDPSKYGDTLAALSGMTLSGLQVHTDGWIKEWDLGSTSEIIPRLVGGTTAQYKCDYSFVGNKNTTLRTFLFGGRSLNGQGAGGGCIGSDYSVDGNSPAIGFRSVSIA